MDLTAGLERAIQTFDVSTQTGKQLAKKLDQFEAMSDRLRELLDRLPERLNDPLKNMSLTAGKFREAALSGEAAFRELKTAAGAAGESLSQTTQRANTTWQMLHEVQASLGELAKSEERQTGEVSKLVQAFAGIGMSLDNLARELDSLGSTTASTRRYRAGTWAGCSAHPSPVGGDCRQCRRTATTDTPGGSIAASGLSPSRLDERPWWRRIFG